MKKRKLPKTRYAFIQDWGSYTNQTLVVIGARDKKDFVTAFKKAGSDKVVLAEVQQLELPKSFKTDNGFFYIFKASGASILYLSFFEDTWQRLEVLIHEIYHAVDFILGENKGMRDEYEARAYQMEYLFHSIRRKLQGCDPVKIVRF